MLAALDHNFNSNRPQVTQIHDTLFMIHNTPTLSPNVNRQILLTCLYTFVIKLVGKLLNKNTIFYC